MLEEGRFSIPVRLLLTQLQRDRLHALCLAQGLDMVDAVTMIVGEYLDNRSDLEAPPAEPSPAVDKRQIQRQIVRLRAQARSLGREAPAWLLAYIADLEQEARNG